MKKLISSLLLITPFLVFAQTPIATPGSGRVLDDANALSVDQVHSLTAQIVKLESAYHIQIAIVLLRQVPGNTSIEDLARSIGRTWHVGNAHNGIVYVAAINEHKQRLEVAAELEGTITDLRAEELTENIKGFFRHQQYYEGISSMLTSIGVMLKPVEQEQKALVDKAAIKKNAKNYENIISVIGIVTFVTLCILAFGWEIKHRQAIKKKKSRWQERLEEIQEQNRQSQDKAIKKIWDKVDIKLKDDSKYVTLTGEDPWRARTKDLVIAALQLGVSRHQIVSLLDARYNCGRVSEIQYELCPRFIVDMEQLIAEQKQINNLSAEHKATATTVAPEPTRYESPQSDPTPDSYGSSSISDSSSGFDGGGASNDW